MGNFGGFSTTDLLSLLSGRSPNRVIETACFDAKVQ